MAAGAWKLIIEDDAGKQIVVPFTRDVITIGRKEGNTIRLTERNVSRNHAKLSKDNAHVVIEDLGSFNGIKLNGDRIDGRVLVHEGDTIQIGDYHLALHAQDGAKAANGQGAAGQQGGPAPRSQAANAPTADDDEFAGDTQRWEPPQGMPGISVQTLPTQEDRAVRSSDELTEKAPHAQSATAETAPVRLSPAERAARGGGFSADNGDTERVTLDMLSSMDPLGLDQMKSGAPSSTERPTRDDELEPTVRQAASPAPVSTPAGSIAPITSSLPHERETRPERSAPHVDPPREVRSSGQHAQLPHTPAAPPRTPAVASVADARGAMEEQTEAVRPSPGAADETLPRLVVLNTIFAGSSFPLRIAEAVIGRTEDNDITIEHKSVSRNHAKIVREGDRVRILDLKSANGVLVNNEEVEQAVLRSGDVVELGRVRMRFVPIGERFIVAADEIERARIADRAGDDFENDSGTGVTNPVRKKQPAGGFGTPSGSYDTFPEPKKSPVLYIAGGIVIVIGIILLIAIIVMASNDDPKPTEPVVVVTPPPLDAIPRDPDDVKSLPDVATNDNVNGTATKDPVDVKAPIDVDNASKPDDKDDNDDKRPFVKKKSDDKPKKKVVDVDKNLADGGKALVQNKFEEAVRLSREVLGESGVNGEDKERARSIIKAACKVAPTTKGCNR